MESNGPAIRPLEEIAAAFRLLARPPFRTLLLLSFVLGLVSASIVDLVGPKPAPEYGFLLTSSTLFFAFASIYVHIAATLAAGGSGDGSAEGWIRAALRRRCLWRYVGASIIAVLLILIGALALVVGAVFVGSWLALTQPAVVLERKGPVEALNRSTEITRPARKPVGMLFAAFYLPVIGAAAVFFAWEIRLDFVFQVLVDVVGTAVAFAATIAFTRVFVKLGGEPTPPLQTLLYKANAGSSSRP